MFYGSDIMFSSGMLYKYSVLKQFFFLKSWGVVAILVYK